MQTAPTVRVSLEGLVKLHKTSGKPVLCNIFYKQMTWMRKLNRMMIKYANDRNLGWESNIIYDKINF